MAIGLATAIRTTRMTAIKDAIDAGTGAGKLLIYSGTRPATGAAITDQTLLASITLNDPCGTVTSGVLTLDIDPLPTDASADNSGTAAWARIVTSADAFVLDMTVSLPGYGGDITLTTLTIVETGPVYLNSAVLTEGNA